MNRDQIVEWIGELLGGEEIVLFDGFEDAFLGVAERFEPIVVRTATDDGIYEKTETKGGTHRYFAVYSYERMLRGIISSGTDHSDAVEYLSFNVIGAYVGPNTPAILYEAER